jgi:hypothetical protein
MKNLKYLVNPSVHLETKIKKFQKKTTLKKSCMTHLRSKLQAFCSGRYVFFFIFFIFCYFLLRNLITFLSQIFGGKRTNFHRKSLPYLVTLLPLEIKLSHPICKLFEKLRFSFSFLDLPS